MSSERSSKWAFIVYPESAPQQWKKILQLSFVSTAISPLHSPDPDGSGEERKKHYHVLLDYDSLKSFEQVHSLAVSVNASRPIKIDNPSGYYQYMIHKNNPEKEQFINGYEAIEKLNGFDSDKLENYTKKQLRAFKKDIINIVEKNGFTEYETLITYLIQNEDVENFDIYLDIVMTNTILFNSFLCSRRNRLKTQEVDTLKDRINSLESRLSHE